MTILSFKKCPKGHRKEYYHPTLGQGWCHWCPKCNRIYDMQNYYNWPILSFIDNFINKYLTIISWENRYILAKRKVGRWIYDPFYKGIKNGCEFCGRKYRNTRK